MQEIKLFNARRRGLTKSKHISILDIDFIPGTLDWTDCSKKHLIFVLHLWKHDDHDPANVERETLPEQYYLSLLTRDQF